MTKRILIVSIIIFMLPFVIFATITPTLLWTYSNSNYYSAPSIFGDTLYVGVKSIYLNALNVNTGKQIWSLKLKGYIKTPVIAKDGTIYVSGSSYLYAISPSGKKLWSFSASKDFTLPAIGADGTIYVGNKDGNLYAVSKSGKMKWKFKTHYGWIYASPVIGTDGTIYFGAYDYYFYAIKPDGTLKWKFKANKYILASAAIDENGTIYFGTYDHYFYAMNPNGTLKWKFKASAQFYTSPLIGKHAIYVADKYYLYSLSFSGKQNWKIKLFNQIKKTPALGYNDTIYVPQDNYKYIVAVSKDGKMLWKFQMQAKSDMTLSKGILYYESYKKVCAVKVEQYSNDESQWPMLGFNPAHIGRIEPVITDKFAPVCPKDLSTDVESNFMFEWTSPFRADSGVKYIIYISTNPKILPKILTLDSNSCRAFNFSKGITYYWKVKALYNGKTIESKVYKFKVK